MAIVISGMIAFAGVIAMQVYWLKRAYSQESQKLSEHIQVSLLEVANSINLHYGYQTPLVNPVQKIAEDYYVVNIHNDFEAKVLEFYLINQFAHQGINTDFEYAIYDCETSRMMYGNYVNMHKGAVHAEPTSFAPVKNLVYYFSLRLPNHNNYIFASLKWWVLLCVIMLIVLLIYLYSIYVILQQKKYAELQRDFINNMTHEFKTPLASMLIAANYLSKQEPISGDEKMSKYAGIIEQQGAKLNAHIEKILSLAKSDVSTLTLEKKPVDVLAVIRETIEQIHLKYEAQIKVECSSSSVMIEADEFHFTNVVYNFLENAIKYCRQTPEITVKVIQKADGWELAFCDNGIGIPEKYHKMVFDRFFRVPTKDSNSINGFGLGLYYVKKICQLHHWKWNVQRMPSGGTMMQLFIR